MLTFEMTDTATVTAADAAPVSKHFQDTQRETFMCTPWLQCCALLSIGF